VAYAILIAVRDRMRPHLIAVRATKQNKNSSLLKLVPSVHSKKKLDTHQMGQPRWFLSLLCLSTEPVAYSHCTHASSMCVQYWLIDLRMINLFLIMQFEAVNPFVATDI
jgi:hypothetical protein